MPKTSEGVRGAFRVDRWWEFFRLRLWRMVLNEDCLLCLCIAGVATAAAAWKVNTFALKLPQKAAFFSHVLFHRVNIQWEKFRILQTRGSLSPYFFLLLPETMLTLSICKYVSQIECNEHISYKPTNRQAGWQAGSKRVLNYRLFRIKTKLNVRLWDPWKFIYFSSNIFTLIKYIISLMFLWVHTKCLLAACSQCCGLLVRCCTHYQLPISPFLRIPLKCVYMFEYLERVMRGVISRV